MTNNDDPRVPVLLAVVVIGVAILLSWTGSPASAPTESAILSNPWSCHDFPIAYEFSDCTYVARLESIWDCPVKLSGAVHYCPALLSLGLAETCAEWIR